MGRWKERAFEADLKAVPEQTRTISGGKVEVTFHETIDEVRACVGELPRPNYWDAFSKAYPTILEWVDRVYEGPKWVRLAVTRSPKRLVDYVSTEIFVE